MMHSLVIIIDQSPIGRNSAVEAIRLAAGIISIGAIEDCKVVFMGDAVYFLNKDSNPKAVNMEPFSEIIKLLELSKLKIYVLKEALELAGLERSDLIPYDKLKLVSANEISQFILKSDASFRF